MPKHTPSPAPGSGTDPGDPGDAVLAAVLIRMWALASGRTLRRDVPPDQLSAEELIAFWADDMTPRAGQHARPGSPDRVVDGQAAAGAGRPVPQPRGMARPAAA